MSIKIFTSILLTKYLESGILKKIKKVSYGKNEKKYRSS